jgi:RNA polymerase sigma-70 factor (ECF subfamily)
MTTSNNIRIDNERIFREVYDTYYGRLCFYAQRFVRDTDDAEDVVQSVFVTLWMKAMRFDTQTALSSFLYISVYNACMNRLKHSAMHSRHTHSISEYYGCEEDEYVSSRIEDEVLWKVFQAIDCLPAECGKIFRMSYIESMSIEEVAEALQISTHTVKSQRARAKKLLQDKLKDILLLLPLLYCC